MNTRQVLGEQVLASLKRKIILFGLSFVGFFFLFQHPLMHPSLIRRLQKTLKVFILGQQADEIILVVETNSLRRINDSYRKIVVVRNHIVPWYDENGIYYIGLEDFCLDYIDELDRTL